MNEDDRDEAIDGATDPDDQSVSQEAEQGDFRVNVFHPPVDENATDTPTEDDYEVTDLPDHEDTKEEIPEPEDENVSNESQEPEVLLAKPAEDDDASPNIRVVKVPSRKVRTAAARVRSQASRPRPQSTSASGQPAQRRSYVPRKKSSPMGPWALFLLLAVIVLGGIAISEKVMISRLTAERDRLSHKVDSAEIESQELQMELESAYRLIRRYRDRTPAHLRKQIEKTTSGK